MTDYESLVQEAEMLLERNKKGMTKEQTDEMLGMLHELKFIVPVNFIKDEAFEKMQKEMKESGKPVALSRDTKTVPILIQNPDKEQFLAAFTQQSQIPEHMTYNGLIEMNLDACVKYVQASNSAIHGVAVNPFSHNFLLKLRKQKQVTEEQFHMLARKNVEFVLLPHDVYTRDKAFYDSIDAQLLYQMFRGQYQDKLPLAYEQDDFDVMQLGIRSDMDMIHISMPTKKLAAGSCERIYITWDKNDNRPGYYMIVRGTEKGSRDLVYIAGNGETKKLMDAPVESMEMQLILDLEDER